MSNIYSAPTADLSASLEQREMYMPTVFQLRGRIGRVRYVAYAFCSLVALSFNLGFVAAFAFSRQPANEPFAMVLVYIPLTVVALMLAIRRLNDLDSSGWWSLLSLIPLVNFFFGLYLLFAPGTAGPNRYGPAPAPNTTLVVIGAWLMPALFIITIVAAVALPAYLGYAARPM